MELRVLPQEAVKDALLRYHSACEKLGKLYAFEKPKRDAPPDMEARRQIARFVRDLKERARRGWDAMDRMSVWVSRKQTVEMAACFCFWLVEMGVKSLLPFLRKNYPQVVRPLVAADLAGHTLWVDVHGPLLRFAYAQPLYHPRAMDGIALVISLSFGLTCLVCHVLLSWCWIARACEDLQTGSDDPGLTDDDTSDGTSELPLDGLTSPTGHMWLPLVKALHFWGLLLLCFTFSSLLQQAMGSGTSDEPSSPDAFAAVSSGATGAAVTADVAGLGGLAKLLGETEAMSAMSSRDRPEGPSEKAMLSCIYKVLCENLAQLYLQSAFFALIFERLSSAGRLKLLGSMALGLLSASKKLLELLLGWVKVLQHHPEDPRFAKPSGFLALLLPLLGLLLVSLIVAKIVAAHGCPSHLWNFTSGCVAESKQSQEEHRQLKSLITQLAESRGQLEDAAGQKRNSFKLAEHYARKSIRIGAGLLQKLYDELEKEQRTRQALWFRILCRFGRFGCADLWCTQVDQLHRSLEGKESRGEAAKEVERQRRRVHPYWIELEELRETLEFTQGQLVEFAILCGCDYATSLPGIGPYRGFRILKDYGSIGRFRISREGRQIPQEVWEHFNYKEDRLQTRLGTVDVRAMVQETPAPADGANALSVPVARRKVRRKTREEAKRGLAEPSWIHQEEEVIIAEVEAEHAEAELVRKNFFGEGGLDSQQWGIVSIQRGSHQLLFVDVLCGIVYEMGEELDRAGTKCNRAWLRSNGYDSVCGGPHQPNQKGPGANHSRLHVVYRANQTYPRFLVTLSEVMRLTRTSGRTSLAPPKAPSMRFTPADVKVSHHEQILAVAWLEDQLCLATVSAVLWDCSAGIRLELPHAAQRAAWSASGQLALAQKNRRLLLLDAFWSKDSKVRIFTAESKEKLHEYTHSSPVLSMAFAPCGRPTLAVGGSDGKLCLLSTNSGTPERSLAPISTGKGGFGRFSLKDTVSNTKIYQAVLVFTCIVELGNWLTALAWSANGERLAAGCDDGKVHIFRSGAEERAIAHEERVCSLTFHPDPGVPIVAAGAVNGKIRLVNTTGGAETVARGEEVATSATWNAAGDALAVGCEGGTLRILFFKSEEKAKREVIKKEREVGQGFFYRQVSGETCDSTPKFEISDKMHLQDCQYGRTYRFDSDCSQERVSLF
eukprot:g24033.t1